MLLTDVSIIVFQLDNDRFEAVGEINEFTSLNWPDAYAGYSTFELYAPVTPENRDLLKKGAVIWCGEQNAATIEVISAETNTKGEKTYIVKGRTLEWLLTTRVISDTYVATKLRASTIMYQLVENNFVSPSNPSRAIPWLKCANDDFLGKEQDYQDTGVEVYESVYNVADDSELGFFILFNPFDKELVFKVVEGTDRSQMPRHIVDENPVILSTDLEDILSSKYYTNDQDEKSVAYVAGEETDSGRVTIISGAEETTGFLRKELYVDAKDLQSEIHNEDGSTKHISEADYKSMLSNRGEQKLSERTITEVFEAVVRTEGSQYAFGIDYFNGDKVIVQDTDLGIQIVGRITEVVKTYGVKSELSLTFGYAFPTLIQRVKQQIGG